tara:strand:+ start:795 stop:1049 length:255 start_codon:yes stop_codon:yes gene_type:complete
MPIKKNDLVTLNISPLHVDGETLNWKIAIVVKGPYEDSITLSHLGSNPINMLTLVCDVIADGKLYYAIPLEHLSRAQKRPDASL